MTQVASGLVHLVSGHFGIRVPQEFVHRFDPTRWGFAEGDADWETLSLGPDTEWYWDSWDWILQRAVMKDKDGHVWTLHQDDDLWAVCVDLMTEEEYVGYFGEPRDRALH